MSSDNLKSLSSSSIIQNLNAECLSSLRQHLLKDITHVYVVYYEPYQYDYKRPGYDWDIHRVFISHQDALDYCKNNNKYLLADELSKYIDDNEYIWMASFGIQDKDESKDIDVKNTSAMHFDSDKPYLKSIYEESNNYIEFITKLEHSFLQNEKLGPANTCTHSNSYGFQIMEIPFN